MSERSDNQKWLLEGAERAPTGWEAMMIAAFGLPGALDLLAVQNGRVHEVDLRHRPFAGNEALKDQVHAARQALSDLATTAYRLWWEKLDETRDTPDGERDAR